MIWSDTDYGDVSSTQNTFWLLFVIFLTDKNHERQLETHNASEWALSLDNFITHTNLMVTFVLKWICISWMKIRDTFSTS